MTIEESEVAETQVWRPGSFTKNFSWGTDPDRGLVELYEVINAGFAGELESIPRAVFRERVRRIKRPDYIPMNFFLFNRPVDGEDHIIADELVFQALRSPHSSRFDKLALFAFIFSFAGRWKGARPEQRRPAMWANQYILDRVAHGSRWDVRGISKQDVELYLRFRKNFTAQTGKLSTNLIHLFRMGRLDDFRTNVIERWWVDALFLAMDRIIEDRALDGQTTAVGALSGLLKEAHFAELSGPASYDKELAIRHLIGLYVACGGINRFSDDAVVERTAQLVQEVELFIANDPRPRGAVHPTNSRVMKTIPPVCAMLAKYAGFDVIGPDEIADFDLEEFVRRRTVEALQNLRERGVSPTMTASDLEKLTREK